MLQGLPVTVSNPNKENPGSGEALPLVPSALEEAEEVIY